MLHRDWATQCHRLLHRDKTLLYTQNATQYYRDNVAQRQWHEETMLHNVSQRRCLQRDTMSQRDDVTQRQDKVTQRQGYIMLHRDNAIHRQWHKETVLDTKQCYTDTMLYYVIKRRMLHWDNVSQRQCLYYHCKFTFETLLHWHCQQNLTRLYDHISKTTQQNNSVHKPHHESTNYIHCNKREWSTWNNHKNGNLHSQIKHDALDFKPPTFSKSSSC